MLKFHVAKCCRVKTRYLFHQSIYQHQNTVHTQVI